MTGAPDDPPVVSMLSYAIRPARISDSGPASIFFSSRVGCWMMQSIAPIVLRSALATVRKPNSSPGCFPSSFCPSLRIA